METEKTAIQIAAEKGASGAMESTKTLSFDDIMGKDDIQRELVEVPEWGGKVWVYSLTSRERDAFEASMIQGRGADTVRNLANLRARLCARCIRDDQGKRIFKGTEKVDALGNKSARALERVFNVARRLCGMTTEDVEELVKN